MRKYSLLIFVAIFIFACGAQPSKPKAGQIIVQGGTVSASMGLGFDVNYDPALDHVVPGYKIITVGYINNSMNLVEMDSINDHWFVEDRRGKKIKAIINLRQADPDTWSTLPKKLKILIEYPLFIPIGSTQTIDLLFPSKYELGAFRSVIYSVGKSKQEIKILPREQ